VDELERLVAVEQDDHLARRLTAHVHVQRGDTAVRRADAARQARNFRTSTGSDSLTVVFRAATARWRLAGADVPDLFERVALELVEHERRHVRQHFLDRLEDLGRLERLGDERLRAGLNRPTTSACCPSTCT